MVYKYDTLAAISYLDYYMDYVNKFVWGLVLVSCNPDVLTDLLFYFYGGWLISKLPVIPALKLKI